jgi:hypothetical protein
MKFQHIEAAITPKDLSHKCEEYCELRERKKGNGSVYADQCQFCGEFRGSEVKKNSVLIVPEPEDTELFSQYKSKKAELSKQLDFNSPPLDSSPSEFESNEEHDLKLERLLQSYCSENRTSIEKVLPAFLTRHREKYIKNNFNDIWHNEEGLKDWFSNTFSNWFEIYPEVEGTGFVDRQQETIRIDFILKAKDELLKEGFTQEYIGVEVKYLNPLSGKGFHGKSSRGIFQALSYWYSSARWSLPDESSAKLSTVLMFSNLSFTKERNIIFASLDSHFRKVWESYLSIANHANVGEVLITTRDNKISWRMMYSGSVYFSMNPAYGFRKGNENLINKKRIGSQKR